MGGPGHSDNSEGSEQSEGLEKAGSDGSEGSEASEKTAERIPCVFRELDLNQPVGEFYQGIKPIEIFNI